MIRFLVLLFSACVAATAAARTPCDRGAGGISHCEGRRFVCNNGTLSQSKRRCNPQLYGTVSGKTPPPRRRPQTSPRGRDENAAARSAGAKPKEHKP